MAQKILGVVGLLVAVTVGIASVGIVQLKPIGTEIEAAEKLAEHSMRATATPEERAEFTNVLSSLKEIKRAHNNYDSHAGIVLELICQARLRNATGLINQAEKEAKQLDHTLQVLRADVTQFTQAAARSQRPMRPSANAPSKWSICGRNKPGPRSAPRRHIAWQRWILPTSWREASRVSSNPLPPRPRKRTRSPKPYAGLSR